MHEKLLTVKAACEEYDEAAADEAVSELRGGAWSQRTGELLERVAVHLLHSDFDEIAAEIEEFIQGV